MLQGKPENYGIGRQHYSVLDVGRYKAKILISNLLNHLFSQSSLPMPDYHAVYEYYRIKKFSLNSIFLARNGQVKSTCVGNPRTSKAYRYFNLTLNWLYHIWAQRPLSISINSSISA